MFHQTGSSSGLCQDICLERTYQMVFLKITSLFGQNVLRFSQSNVKVALSLFRGFLVSNSGYMPRCGSNIVVSPQDFTSFDNINGNFCLQF